MFSVCFCNIEKFMNTNNRDMAAALMTAIKDIDMVLGGGAYSSEKSPTAADGKQSADVKENRAAANNTPAADNTSNMNNSGRLLVLDDRRTQTHDIDRLLRTTAASVQQQATRQTNDDDDANTNYRIITTADSRPSAMISTIGKRLSIFSHGSANAAAAVTNSIRRRSRRAMSHPLTSAVHHHRLSVSEAAIRPLSAGDERQEPHGKHPKLIIDVNLQDIDLLTTIPKAKETAAVTRITAELKQRAFSDPLVTEYVYLENVHQPHHGPFSSSPSPHGQSSGGANSGPLGRVLEYTGTGDRQPVMPKYNVDIDRMINSGGADTFDSDLVSAVKPAVSPNNKNAVDRAAVTRSKKNKHQSPLSTLVRKPTNCTGSLDTVLIQIPRTSRLDDAALFARPTSGSSVHRQQPRRQSGMMGAFAAAAANIKQRSTLSGASSSSPFSLSTFSSSSLQGDAANANYTENNNNNNNNNNSLYRPAAEDIDHLIGLSEPTLPEAAFNNDDNNERGDHDYYDFVQVQQPAVNSQQATMPSPRFTPNNRRSMAPAMAETACKNGCADSSIQRPAQSRIDVDFLLRLSAADGDGDGTRRESVKQLLNSPEYQVSLSAALLSINREDGQQLDVEHSLIPTQTSANSAKVPSDGSQNTSLAQQSSSIEFAPPVANQVTRNADGYSKAIQDGRDIDGMISDSNFVATRKPSARLLAEEEFTNIFGI